MEPGKPTEAIAIQNNRGSKEGSPKESGSPIEMTYYLPYPGARNVEIIPMTTNNSRLIQLCNACNTKLTGPHLSCK